MSESPASCLHLVAGDSAEALADCLAHTRGADMVLFLDAGVLHLLNDCGTGAVVIGVCFLKADLLAHGLLPLARRRELRVIDDAGFCALLVEHRHCLTWT